MNKLTAAIAACLMAFTTQSVSAADDLSGRSSFYERKSEGWFWYEPEPEPVPEIEEPKKEVPAVPEMEQSKSEASSESKEVVVNVQWLRENLPKLRDEAIDNPSYENVSRYYYAQRIMMDKANKFASVAQEVSVLEVALNEQLRRPTHQSMLYQFKGEAKKNREAVFDQINEQAGLFFFYSSGCSYCIQQAPILKRLTKETGIDVLAVSLDGRTLPGGEYPDYVTDPGTLRQKLQVMVTPTIYLVKKDGSEFHNVASGITSVDELLKRIVMVANRQRWISEDLYHRTQDVREILIADDTKEKITVDEKQVFEDPNYLSDMLRKKFREKYQGTESLEYGEVKPK